MLFLTHDLRFMRSLLFYFFSIVLLLTCSNVFSQWLKISTKEQLDQRLANFETEISPGFSLIVLKNNAAVYTKNTGLAELKSKSAINEQTVFRVASLSKQFTAACILILEEKGWLSLDDPLSLYFPEFPDYAADITLRNLIHHTSGIRDFFKLANLSGYEEADFNSDQAVLKMIARQKKLNFEPGTDMLYNNSGYFLLGLVVQKVSGLSIHKFAEEFIFKPLDMKNTGFYCNEIKGKENRAYGYKKNTEVAQAYVQYDSELKIAGDGGLFTNVEDLAKWDMNFYDNQLPIKNFAARMYTRGRLNNGDLLHYAFGLEHSTIMGYDCISHSGAYVGYRSAILRIPSKRISVICLGNSAELQAAQICEKVAEIVLDASFTSKQAETEATKLPFERSTIQLDAHIFKGYEGKFELANGQILHFYEKNKRYFVDIIGQTNIEIFPASILNFFVKETDISFTFIGNSSDKAAMVVLHIGDKRLLAKRIIDGQSNIQKLNEYVGAYYNEELNVTYKLIIESDNLFIQIDDKPKKAIDLIRKDKMILGEGLAQFRRDKAGRIAAFYLEAGSVRDLLFVKK